MKDIIPIDIAFDFADDYLEGRKDPDGHNNILCNWHKTLWEKELPYNKGFFTLDKKRERYNYLYHNSNLGEHFLTSDAIINEYYDYLSNGRHKDMQLIISQFSKEDINSFFHKITTIGGYIVFPIGKGYTLNQARGCSGKISDRFDLTLECIRLYYNNEIDPLINPLAETICRYKNFFQLFTDFRGYCEFFLLQDLTKNDYSEINFFLPFNSFSKNPKPSSVEEYNIFKNKCMDFISKRNHRIEQYANEKMLLINNGMLDWHRT